MQLSIANASPVGHVEEPGENSTLLVKPQWFKHIFKYSGLCGGTQSTGGWSEAEGFAEAEPSGLKGSAAANETQSVQE